MLDSIQPPKKYIPKSERPRTKRRTRLIILTLVALILIIPAFYALKTGLAFSKIVTIKNIAWEKIFGKLPSSEYKPEKDPDRINALVLGIRGENDPNVGALLSDGIMMISFKKSTGQIALISIPRDLYLQMPGEVKYEKVNAAYAMGLEKYNNGLDYAKKTIAYITGQYIEYGLVVNFEAFKDIIELVGGVTIYLDKPFIEDKQWLCDKNGENCQPFIVEAGTQTLDGERALLYVRSRFSSNDFDRARRQQQVLLALKDKLLSLGVLADPLKISGILDIISKNIKTDVTPWEIPQLIDMAGNAKTDKIITKVFENSEQGLLYQTEINGIYVLLPTEGNFSKIRETCKNIFSL
ncbi:MAG: LCP family protein [Patescibacteria group bacterium]